MPRMRPQMGGYRDLNDDFKVVDYPPKCVGLGRKLLIVAVIFLLIIVTLLVGETGYVQYKMWVKLNNLDDRQSFLRQDQILMRNETALKFNQTRDAIDVQKKNMTAEKKRRDDFQTKEKEFESDIKFKIQTMTNAEKRMNKTLKSVFSQEKDVESDMAKRLAEITNLKYLVGNFTENKTLIEERVEKISQVYDKVMLLEQEWNRTKLERDVIDSYATLRDTVKGMAQTQQKTDESLDGLAQKLTELQEAVVKSIKINNASLVPGPDAQKKPESSSAMSIQSPILGCIVAIIFAIRVI